MDPMKFIAEHPFEIVTLVITLGGYVAYIYRTLASMKQNVAILQEKVDRIENEVVKEIKEALNDIRDDIKLLLRTRGGDE